MEDKLKYKNILNKEKKQDDTYQNEKPQSLIKTNSTLLLNTPYKFDYINKNKDLNLFKNEILSFVRERDNFYLEKIKNLQIQSNNNNKTIEELSNIIQLNINNNSSKELDISTKLEKIKTYEAFMNKANDKIISHEIRINNLREELSKSNQKYDKIYLENLELPGYIGKSSKYPNCKIFFTEVIKELDKFNKYKEKNTIDLYTYKDKLENIIKTFQTIVENNNATQIKYITKLNDKTNKSILDIMEEKIKNVRMENSIFASDLIKKSNELNILYDKINTIKINIIEEFNNISEIYNKKIEETNKLFDEYKVEYEIIKNKFLELADFIKNGRFSRNFGASVGRKEINSMSKKLRKDLKNEIEPKNVKLMNNNIEQIQNMDFKVKNTIDAKSSYNINNIRKIKFSKSQNNFNHNNYMGKKRVFGFGKQKNNNSPAQKKDEYKLNQGSLYYYTGKTLTDINSAKNISNKKSIFKNTNLDLENLKTKNNNIPKENPKSERQTKIKTENIIKKLKKEKINNNNLENIDLKTKKTKREKDSRNNHNINDDLSISESGISNINNSINTFSTTNEKNNSFNSINLNNNNKVGKFNLFEPNIEDHNDKIIKEIASDLEQSTAKGNNLASKKKEIEDNFKSICNRIQPVNLKLITQNKLEKIEECAGEKNNNTTNKSDQNTTIFSHNKNINNNNNDNSNNYIGKSNKLKELIELTEKLEENNNSLRTNRTNYTIKNNNENNGNNNIDKRMNLYDKKLGDLESFTKEKILDVNKEIGFLKKLLLINDYHTINNNSAHSRINIFNKSNKNDINNENKNILNLTSNYFNKKSPSIEINQRLIAKKTDKLDEMSLSDNLFYNGNYYFNIKDILDKKKNTHHFENKKLLKSIDNRTLEEKINKKNNI